MLRSVSRYSRHLRLKPGHVLFSTSANDQYRIYTNIDDPNSPLRQKTEQMSFPLSDADRRDGEMLIQKSEMENTCVGFSAPQFGVRKRMMVVRIPFLVFMMSPDASEIFNTTLMINPSFEAIEAEGTQSDWEACYSDPKMTGWVTRAQAIRYHAFDINGKNLYGTAQGLLARIFQHELDHLDGIVFRDRATQYRTFTEVYGQTSMETIHRFQP